jgi:putative ABC transport system permease protein
MTTQDALKTAWRGVTHSKARSFLTMLGIIIGVSSVVLLMSLGASAERLIVDQVKSIGSNLVFVIPGASKSGKFSSPASAQGIIIKTLVKSDVDALKREPSIAAVGAEVRGQAKVVYEGNDITATFEGVDEQFFKIRDFKLAKGRLIERDDVNSFERVVVIGSELATTLFGSREPLGKAIRIKDATFRVVGILEPMGVGAFGVDQDNLMLLPLSVAQKQLLGVDYYGVINIAGSDAYDITYVKSRVTSILREGHRITDPDKDDFTVRTQEDAVALLGNITGILTAFLTAIASISLVVGGIGIMNIMLVTVTERTREIGLRKALGATDRDIMIQFLFEALSLTSLGGLIGIILGATFVGITYVVLVYIVKMDWVFALPTSALVLSVLVSTITGIAFGIYPARKAAKKNPIDALRYE